MGVVGRGGGKLRQCFYFGFDHLKKNLPPSNVENLWDFAFHHLKVPLPLDLKHFMEIFDIAETSFCVLEGSSLVFVFKTVNRYRK